MKQVINNLKDFLSVTFADKTMEQEYFVLKTQNSRNDFKATSYYLAILNILIIIVSASPTNPLVLGIGIGSLAVGFILFVAQYFLKKGFQYLTLILLVIYMFTRLACIYFQYEFYTKGVVYFLSYIYAVNQLVILGLIHNFPIKILTVVVSFGLRTWVLATVEPYMLEPPILIRQFLVDLFIIYILFSNEKNERRIFRNFFENRDELIKFKELLADSLPQGVIIVDFQTQERLFVNNSFSNFFMSEKETSLEENKLDFNKLQLDLTTLREVGTQQEEQNSIPLLPAYLLLEDFLIKLLKENYLSEKSFSINASAKQKEQQKAFEITFKKVKWNRTDAIALILNDITYQENLGALKMANANKDQIIATVSHELRTPLHGIIGLLEIAETKVRDNKEVQNTLSLCKDNAHLLASLVNSLLDLHQLSTGKLKLNEARMNIRKTLKNVVQLFKFQCDQKNISLQIDVHKDVPFFLISDENRFKQVLINLIGNAVKFTFRGGVKIEVCQDPEDDRSIVISVNDTGIGIKEDDLGKLFKLYGKLTDDYAVNKHGVGLGLTISNTLAVLLSGQKVEKGIQVVSRYGEGSSFSFRILKHLRSSEDFLTDRSPGRVDSVAGEFEIQKTQDTSFERVQTRENDMFEKEVQSLFLATEFFDEQTVQSKVSIYLCKQKEIQGSREILLKTCEHEENISESNRDVKWGPSKNKFSNHQDSPFKIEGKRDSQMSTQQGECILVVDDNPFNILVAKSLLKDLGYEVKSASGGKEAIEIVQSCAKEGIQIKVIFMDCQMPIMDGFETSSVLSKMMQKGKIPKTPILAWTANNGEEDIKRCYESGMTGHLLKPTTKENVIKTISTCISVNSE